jgi:DNA repair exonuclease SbcCD nuclease subunit
MPKLFEYLGILIYFYSNEHEPIHVHAKKAECESKAEFYIIDGIITEVKITEVKGKKPIIGNDLKNFEIFLENYSEKVVQKWVDYFVYHKDIKFEKITKKLR